MAVKLQVVMSIPGKDPREFEYEFEESRISIGRDQDNEIQVPLSTVSRKHCVLFQDGDEWYLEDLKSTHGTKHNGRPVGAGGKKLLRDGNTIDLIHFQITFQNRDRVSPDYSVEKTEALARKMVEEVLASIGRDGGEVPYLRVMNGPDEGKQFPVGVDIAEAVIGRGTDCDFEINDANISRRHAIIRRDWNEITVEDAGSKNGVEINGRKIARATPLRDADELLLGAVRLTFIDPSAKFIGKLDDIPAFADAATDLDDETAATAGNDEDAPADGEDASADDPETYARADADEGPGGRLNHDAAAANGASVDEAVDPEPDPFDDDPPPPRGLGTFELVLIGGAVLAVIGLAVGVAVLVIGS
ncbi:MAG: FHA domain-containing protein [Deltaproteobacteria bacterium]|nr:FHA domain-containing protein [Deltaproteobacteria bacterium]